MPVSSSRVMRTSKGPCFKEGSARMAKQVATPMPSSAPREVPVAMSHLLSTIRGVRGSVSKLICTSSFFSTTMSMWHCKQMEGLSSRPGQ